MDERAQCKTTLMTKSDGFLLIWLRQPKKVTCRFIIQTETFTFYIAL